MELRDCISIVTVLIGAVSLFFSIREYIKRGNKDRAEFFLRLRDRFKSNDLYMHIQLLVEADNDAELHKIPAQDLNRLIGFYEEIYLFSKSNFMSRDVLFYMFGQYATDCYRNAALRQRMKFDEEFHWQKFASFCREFESWKAANPSFEFRV